MFSCGAAEFKWGTGIFPAAILLQRGERIHFFGRRPGDGCTASDIPAPSTFCEGCSGRSTSTDLHPVRVCIAAGSLLVVPPCMAWLTWPTPLCDKTRAIRGHATRSVYVVG